MNEVVPTPVKSRCLRTRVFVIEDHILMRRSIVEAIQREPDLTVCGEAEDASEALAAIAALQPDVVLTDLQLKSSSGFDLIKALRASVPALPVIATTIFDLRRNEQLARMAGAAVFVSKQEGPERLVTAVREVLKAAREHGDWSV